DFDPLRRIAGVNCLFANPNQPLPKCDLLILPGSKNTQGDLAWLREQGWDAQIAQHLRYGGKLLGVCGGYQMLGEEIIDSEGIESQQLSSNGLGYIPMVTKLVSEKQLRNVVGQFIVSGAPVAGYEIHLGQSEIHGAAFTPLFQLRDGRTDGVISPDGQIIGTYLHGLFDQPEALTHLMQWAGWHGAGVELPDADAILNREIDRLSDAIDAAMDWQKASAAGWLCC
ncbi:MAG: cobyric acid synthase, partial [Deefgea sp.]